MTLGYGLFDAHSNSEAELMLSQLLSAVDFSDQGLWFQIAVGRLGVITEVELSILPQDMVERLTFETSFADFVDAMMDLQEDYTEAVNGTSSRTVAEVLSDYEGTQVDKDCALTEIIRCISAASVIPSCNDSCMDFAKSWLCHSSKQILYLVSTRSCRLL